MPPMISTTSLAALESAVDELPAGLQEHVLRVVAEVRRLAQMHGVDEERAVVAALGHDLVRAMRPDELIAAAEHAGLTISDVEHSEPILLHGAIGASLMMERYGVSDEEVLAAARYHTTAHAGMSQLERLIYVADKVEPGKSQGDARLTTARQLAEESLEAAMRVLLDLHVTRALERDWPLHPQTVAARNELLRDAHE